MSAAKSEATSQSDVQVQHPSKRGADPRPSSHDHVKSAQDGKSEVNAPPKSQDTRVGSLPPASAQLPLKRPLGVSSAHNPTISSTSSTCIPPVPPQSTHHPNWVFSNSSSSSSSTSHSSQSGNENPRPLTAADCREHGLPFSEVGNVYTSDSLRQHVNFLRSKGRLYPVKPVPGNTASEIRGVEKGNKRRQSKKGKMYKSTNPKQAKIVQQLLDEAAKQRVSQEPSDKYAPVNDGSEEGTDEETEEDEQEAASKPKPGPVKMPDPRIFGETIDPDGAVYDMTVGEVWQISPFHVIFLSLQLLYIFLFNDIWNPFFHVTALVLIFIHHGCVNWFTERDMRFRKTTRHLAIQYVVAVSLALVTKALMYMCDFTLLLYLDWVFKSCTSGVKGIYRDDCPLVGTWTLDLFSLLVTAFGKVHYMTVVQLFYKFWILTGLSRLFLICRGSTLLPGWDDLLASKLARKRKLRSTMILVPDDAENEEQAEPDLRGHDCSSEQLKFPAMYGMYSIYTESARSFRKRPWKFLFGDPKEDCEYGQFSFELLHEFLQPGVRKPRATLEAYRRQLEKSAMVVKHINVERGTAVSRGTIEVATFLHARDEQNRPFYTAFQHSLALPKTRFPLPQQAGEGQRLAQ